MSTRTLNTEKVKALGPGAPGNAGRKWARLRRKCVFEAPPRRRRRGGSSRRVAVARPAFSFDPVELLAAGSLAVSAEGRRASGDARAAFRGQPQPLPRCEGGTHVTLPAARLRPSRSGPAGCLDERARPRLARAGGQATSLLHLRRSHPQLPLPDGEPMFGRLGRVHEGKFHPTRSKRVLNEEKGDLGCVHCMIKSVYHIYSERAYFHKRPKLDDRTSPSS